MTGKHLPRYRRQKSRHGDRAFVELGGRRVYLGPHDSPESRREYDRVLAEWLESGRRPEPTGERITIVQLLHGFWEHAVRHYRQPDGTPSQELANYKAVLSLLRHLYADHPVEEFTPRALKATRRRMIQKGWSRRSINRQVVRIRSIFKWGVSEGLVPVDVHAALTTVTGLQAGRTEAHEKAPIRPVEQDQIEAVIPHLPPVVADMVRIQLLTGMRPTETCTMRPADIDTRADVWIYRPQRHKTLHRGRQRVICIGPKGQDVLRPYITDRPAGSYLFSPAEGERRRRSLLHAQRVTPASCGNGVGANRKPQPKRSPRERYDKNSYAQAVARGCAKAFPAPSSMRGNERDAWNRAHRWTPNQLRHTTATSLRDRFGLEAAQIILGHARADVTQLYAEANHAKALDIATMVG